MPVVYLIGNTASSTWTPTTTGPAVVELWGAGACGGAAGGGDGGDYVKLNAFNLTSGTPITFSLGGPGSSQNAAGGDTWWSSSSTALAAGGISQEGGGTKSTSIGDVINAGGGGGQGGNLGENGGGGAGGPNGVGGAGGQGSDNFYSGSGGGGSNGGGAGGVPSSGLSGAGGTNFAGQAGGAASSSGDGGAGVNNGSGGAGGYSDGTFTSNGGNGAADYDLGGGGGGAGGNDGFDASGTAGAGGTPGGGASGAYRNGNTDPSFASPGGWGEIKITTPGGGAQFFYYGTFVPNVDTAFLSEPEGNESVVAAATSTVNGALTLTEAVDTLASVGRVLAAGTLVVAEAVDSLSATGNVSGSFLTITEDNDQIISAGTVLVSGGLSQIEISDTLSGTASPLGANLVITEALDTLVATGALIFSGGSLSITEVSDVLSGAAALAGIFGTILVTEVSDAVSIVGQITGPIASFSFNPSTADVGLYVLHRVGVARTMVTSEHLADLQMAANYVLSDMSTTQPNLWSVTLNQVPLSQGVPTYILPSNILLVLNCYIQTIVDGIAFDRVIFGVSRDDYAAYPNKLLQQPPTVYWADRSEPIKMNVYPVPDGNVQYTLCYYAVQRDADAVVASDTVTTLPFRFLAAFKDMLVAELAPTYAPTKQPMFSAIAEASRKRADIQDREIVPIHITPGLSKYYR